MPHKQYGKTYQGHDVQFRLLVTLPLGPSSLEHKRVHPRADVSGRQCDLVRDACREVDCFSFQLRVAFVLGVLPEAEVVSGEATPPLNIKDIKCNVWDGKKC